ncbi:MAG: hypothetical protein CL910_20115 [Deltaproteobacteria bacterium]|nr:hypothetical protein [Deltaproteobacteria bacterium]
MLLAVALQVLGAVLLKELADRRIDREPLWMAGGLVVVMALNGLRLATWSLAHARYPVQRTLPFGALFFPAMLAVAVLAGDPIGSAQVAGAALITVGAAYLQQKGNA